MLLAALNYRYNDNPGQNTVISLKRKYLESKVKVDYTTEDGDHEDSGWIRLVSLKAIASFGEYK